MIKIYLLIDLSQSNYDNENYISLDQDYGLLQIHIQNFNTNFPQKNFKTQFPNLILKKIHSHFPYILLELKSRRFLIVFHSRLNDRISRPLEFFYSKMLFAKVRTERKDYRIRIKIEKRIDFHVDDECKSVSESLTTWESNPRATSTFPYPPFDTLKSRGNVGFIVVFF